MPGGSDIGTGLTIAFGTSSWTAEIADANWSGIERAIVEMTHHGSTQSSTNEVGGRTYVPGDLEDPGTLDLDVNFDPSDWPPINGVAETITLTYKKKTGDSTSATAAGTGFIASMSKALPVDEKMSASISVKLSGVWALTDAT